MWVRDVDGGIFFWGGALVGSGFVVLRRAGVGRAAALAVVGRLVVDDRDAVEDTRGLEVTLESIEGSLDLLGFAGAVAGAFAGGPLGFDLGIGADASDIGGDGGSWTGVLDDDTDPGGVETSGELAPDIVLLSNMGLSGMDRSVDIVDRWRCSSCFLSLSWRISASILRSDSSSRSLCASILSCSRSCSPILISSSIMTALSIVALYFDSMSSREESVMRACRSKSSFATSMSRSLCCNVRFVSLKVVISFSSVFCAAFASVLDSLYFLCEGGVSDDRPLGNGSASWEAVSLPSTRRPRRRGLLPSP